MYIAVGVSGVVILATSGLLMTHILGAIGFGAEGIAGGKKSSRRATQYISPLHVHTDTLHSLP